MRSVVQDQKECLVCGTNQGLHLHHIFYGTSNRKQSDKYGLTVWLCGPHHNLSNDGVHFNRDLDLTIKREAQHKFEEIYGTREFFIQEFGKSYL